MFTTTKGYMKETGSMTNVMARDLKDLVVEMCTKATMRKVK